MKQEMTFELASNLWSYDAQTGDLWWLASAKSQKTGQKAGKKATSGYRRVKYRGSLYAAHRLAWLLHYGEHPIFDLDHINGEKSDNRICNLRDVCHSINLQNQREARSNNRLGVLGVQRYGNSYRARIGANGRLHHIGTFVTVEEAYAAYLGAKRRLHEGCTI